MEAKSPGKDGKEAIISALLFQDPEGPVWVQFQATQCGGYDSNPSLEDGGRILEVQGPQGGGGTCL